MASRRSASVRYAKALFGLAQETGRVDAVRDELNGLLAAIAEVPGLADVFIRPLHPARERLAALAQLAGPLGLSPLVANFCAFLIDQRRTRDLAGIRDEFVRLAEEAAGRVRGEIVTAAPLEQSQLERIRSALARRLGRQVDLEIRVDPGLVGGLVARVGDLVFDGSLRSQLEQLRAQLTGER
ncbi:MAG: ATP synthase F1 subunit delta [Proteobacteria bacterium]|nr:MAG: ATP synthase F1 subunit delta [Pseudomonadota bacterium]